MAKCIYCGEDVGLLRKFHKECKSKNDTGKSQIADIAQKAASFASNLEEFDTKLKEIAKASFIDSETQKNLLIEAFEKGVEQALNDDLLSNEEEKAIDAYKDHFKLKQTDLDNNGAYTKLVQSSVLRDLMEGKIETRINVQGQLPFNLQKSEKLVWVFQDVEYYEERKRTTYSGGYSGVSVRVAKGLYYRTGGFRGNPIVTSQTVHVDTGILGVTDKHIYFTGAAKSFRVPYQKIVSFAPYEDGFGLQRDATTAKPQTFLLGDGWFVFNLVTNLAKM